MNNQELIKEALSYEVSSDLHETWRAPRKLENGSYDSRYKKSKDEEWNIIHGTDEADIANLSFRELPFNCKQDYLEEAEVIVNLVFDKVMTDDKFNSKEIDDMASIIHNEWLKRNDWVLDPDYGEPELTVFTKLDKKVQNKYKNQVMSTIKKVEEYKEGKINIAAICEQYGLSSNTRIR